VAWQQLLVRLDADDVARAEALLELAGGQALALADAEDTPLVEPPTGQTPLWPRVVLRALFPAGTDLGSVARLLGDIESAADIRSDVLAEEEWVLAWRRAIHSRDIGRRLRVTPADEGPPDGARRQVKLHMGLAFGTGEHPTTLLCLEWLERELTAGRTVIDYGTGSGVLAIAALRLGAAFAWATDTDSQACEAAADNARLNAVEERIWIGPPRALPEATADIVLANIVARPLAALATRFAAHTAERGHVVLSGLLEAQADEVVRAYSHDYEDFDIETRDGWARIAARRRTAP
jgi:ribosomal protein L11 methyltransferase